MGNPYLRSDQVEDPFSTLSKKLNTIAEYQNYINLATSTRTWLFDNGLADPSSEDAILMRFGMPYLASFEEVDAQSVLDGNGDVLGLSKSIGVDFIQISTKVQSGDFTGYSQGYSYKSTFSHDPWPTAIVAGIENRSGFPYLDAAIVLPGLSGSIPIEYSGELAKQRVVLPMPSFISECFVYLAQNGYLSYRVTDNDVPRPSEYAFFSTTDMYGRLQRTIDIAADRMTALIIPPALEAPSSSIPPPSSDGTVDEVPISLDEAIKEMLEFLDMDEGFKDLQYGGLISGLSLLIRIPASRDNQRMLEQMLTFDRDTGLPEEFQDVFTVEYMPLNDNEANAAGDYKAEHLNDPVSNTRDNAEYGYPELEDVESNFFGSVWGCRSSESTRRFFLVSDEWLNSLTPEQISIIFWTGIDLSSIVDDPPECVLDKVIIVIIIIVITILSWGTAGSAAGPIGQAILVAGAVANIALTLDIVGNGTFRDIVEGIAIASAVFTAGASAYSVGFKITTETLKFALTVASTSTNILIEADLQSELDEIADLEKQTEKATEDAELYESELRFTYGESFNEFVNAGPEADPYAYLDNIYDKFSSYHPAEPRF